MKIDSSDIQLTSQHATLDKHSVRESIRAWTGAQRPDFEGRNATPRQAVADLVSLSREGMAAQRSPEASASNAIDDAQSELDNDPRMQLLLRMVEALTGRKIKIMSMRDFQATQAAPVQNQSPSASAGYGIEYERHETSYEAEQTSFSAQGVIKTADGKEIEFKLQLNMNREHTEQNDFSMRLGDAQQKASVQPKTKDPLVINFDGNAAQLTSTKFSFDLDSDGNAEKISFAAPGSAFLALDKNQDGKINNGKELFGPTSGNGFQELAGFDQDGNHWIDENDAVFADLKVWSKDAQGSDHLLSLKEAGVGALFLGNVSTEFSVKDASNTLNGQVRSSSVYLNENGTVGSLQQIDLTV